MTRCDCGIHLKVSLLFFYFSEKCDTLSPVTKEQVNEKQLNDLT